MDASHLGASFDCSSLGSMICMSVRAVGRELVSSLSPYDSSVGSTIVSRNAARIGLSSVSFAWLYMSSPSCHGHQVFPSAGCASRKAPIFLSPVLTARAA